MQAPVIETLTLFFTDIEGSTKLWEEFPEQMHSMLADHDRLLRSVIEEHGGRVFKTIGDAFCAVFRVPYNAVAAAQAAQQRLLTEKWPNEKPMLVRIALHTGSVESREDDFFGQPLNRVARLLAAAHGGQVLLSRATHELVRDEHPPETSFLDLGEHRLKDLARPEHVFQLLGPGMPAEFQALRTLNSFPNNLPEQLTTFIGRDDEIAAIRNLLKEARLVSVVGAGGCGKTRIVLQIAASLLDKYPDGVWFVPLEGVPNGDLVPQAVAQAIGIIEEPGRPILQTLTSQLQTKKTLLVLDNCEHVVAACARVVDTLLKSAPELRVLTSTREALNIPGERNYRLPSLRLPDATRPVSKDELSQYESVQLFIDRALAASPNFEITNQNAAAVASICARLDGVPLAIELAAARLRSLSPDEINSKLDNRFRLLTGGSRTALPRQQTLKALIDWSYDLLNEQERALWRNASVFQGGWRLEQAEQICCPSGGVIESWEVFDLLSSLFDKSLVIADPQEGGTRYRMLESLRQYGNDKLQESGDFEDVSLQHARTYAALAQELGPQVRGHAGGEATGRLNKEHENIRAALLYSLESEGDEHLAQEICSSLWLCWWNRGYASEAVDLLRRVVDHPALQELSQQRLECLYGLGWLSYSMRDLDASLAAAKDLEEGATKSGSQISLAAAYNLQGVLHDHRLNREQALAAYEKALEINRSLPEGGRSMANLHNISLVLLKLGRFAEAVVRLEESGQQALARDDIDMYCLCLVMRGQVVMAEGKLELARELLDDALTRTTERGLTRRALDVVALLGSLELMAGNAQRALELLRQAEAGTGWQQVSVVSLAELYRSLALAHLAVGEDALALQCLDQGLVSAVSESELSSFGMLLVVKATLLARLGEGEEAARILGAGVAWLGKVPEADTPTDMQRIDEAVQAVRGLIGDETYERILAEGAALVSPEVQDYDHLRENCSALFEALRFGKSTAAVNSTRS